MKNNKLSSIYNAVLELVERFYYVLLLIVLLVTAFNVFYNINVSAILDWDEARHGVSAFEMIRNNNYIVNTYNNAIDYWNLKPPLSYWTIMLGYKLFGYNSIGLRFFSGMSVIGTVLILAMFTKKKSGKLASLISASVLTTTYVYITSHCGRTGDPDALFVFLFTVAILSLILAEENIKWLYVAAIAFSLAFLTKSWHAVNIIAIGGFYLLLSGKLFKLKLKEWIGSILCVVIPILIWGLLRYRVDGINFFKTMIEYDLLERSSKAIEGHSGNVLYYFDIIKQYYFYWAVLLAGVFGAYLALYSTNNDKKRRNYILIIVLWILIPFILFTEAKSKLFQYIIPVFPPMALCIGSFAAKLLKRKELNMFLKFLLIFMIFFNLCVYEIEITKDAKNYLVDNVQLTLKGLGNLKSHTYSGNKIYIADGDKADVNSWSQSRFLAAELYGNLYPTDGGLKQFLEDTSSNSLILLTKSQDAQYIINTYNLKIIYSTSTNCIASKK